MKTCSKCKKSKTLDEFNKSRNGHSNLCKLCDRQKAKEYRERNLIKERTRTREQYHRKKRGEIPIRQPWIWKRTDAIRFASKKYKHKRRSQLAVIESHTHKEWLALLLAYNNTCAQCRCASLLTEDHIIPLSRGGTNKIANIQPLCGSCNSRKGTKIIFYL